VANYEKVNPLKQSCEAGKGNFRRIFAPLLYSGRRGFFYALGGMERKEGKICQDE